MRRNLPQDDLPCFGGTEQPVNAFADRESARNILEMVLKTSVRVCFLAYMHVDDLAVVAER